MTTVFLGLVGGLLVYEFIALRNECEGDTISEIVWSATTKRPLVPFAAGVLCGHFFWQRAGDGEKDARRASSEPAEPTPTASSSPAL